MRRILVAAALSASLGVLPAGADPYVSVYLHHAHAIEYNVITPLRTATAAGEADYLMLSIAKVEGMSTDEYAPVPETGGCIEVWVGDAYDYGCGPLEVTTDGAMGTTHVAGVIVSETPNGPSAIHVDLTFTGEGHVEPDQNPFIAVGVCGLPPFTTGVGVIAAEKVSRPATTAGTLSSDVLGDIDVSAVAPAMAEAFFTADTACAA